jgi:hypothetical protein
LPEFGTIQHVTQLELENFAQLVKAAEEGSGGTPLLAQEIRRRNEAARQALRDKLDDGEIPDWAETYHRLLNAGWPWRVAAYVAWASMPRQRRAPATQEELARDVLGLSSDRVISTWRKKYPIDQMIADLQADELLEDRADVFFALKTMAKMIDYKAATDRKIYLEMIGAYIPVTKLAAELRKRGISADDLDELTNEELWAIAHAAKEVSDKRAAGDQPVEGGKE